MTFPENIKFRSREERLGDLIAITEVDYERNLRLAPEITRFDALITTLGGRKIDSFPIPSQTVMVGKMYPPKPSGVLLQVYQPSVPFEELTFGEYGLDELLKQKPKYPDLWRRIASGGKVVEKVITQDADMVDLRFPDMKMKLFPEDRVEILFGFCSDRVFKWPQTAYWGLYVFPEIPVLFNKAFTIFSRLNMVEGGFEKLFREIDPGHYNYKEGSYLRMAISFEAGNLRRLHVDRIDLTGNTVISSSQHGFRVKSGNS